MSENENDWINKQKQLHDGLIIQDNMPMSEINMHLIFINNNKHIDHITTYKHHTIVRDPTDTYYHISQSAILKIIHDVNDNPHTSKYKLSEILAYIIDIKPEHVYDYTYAGETIDTTLKSYPPIIHELKIPDSIFIFHSINSIYLLFKEPTFTYKSILKRKHNNDSSHKITKKVRIQTNIHIDTSQPSNDTDNGTNNHNKYTRKNT
jgi:hypothetical protein